MATVIERPSERVIDRREIVDRGDSGAGWAVALIILVALVIAGFVWARYYRAPAAPASTGSSINVSLPSVPGTTNSGGGSTGGGSGSTGGTPSSGSGAGSTQSPTQ